MTDETFGNFLRRKYHEWSGKQLGRTGRIPSQNEFAKWLNVPPTSLSMWVNDVRVPSDEAVHSMADKLGVEVYDKLNLPRRLPRNRLLLKIVDIWDRLDEQGQKELAERAKNIMERSNQPENHVDINQ